MASEPATAHEFGVVAVERDDALDRAVKRRLIAAFVDYGDLFRRRRKRRKRQNRGKQQAGHGTAVNELDHLNSPINWTILVIFFAAPGGNEEKWFFLCQFWSA